MSMKEEWRNFLIPECFGSKTAGDSEKQTDCICTWKLFLFNRAEYVLV